MLVRIPFSLTLLLETVTRRLPWNAAAYYVLHSWEFTSRLLGLSSSTAVPCGTLLFLYSYQTKLRGCKIVRCVIYQTFALSQDPWNPWIHYKHLISEFTNWPKVILLTGHQFDVQNNSVWKHASLSSDVKKLGEDMANHTKWLPHPKKRSPCVDESRTC